MNKKPAKTVIFPKPLILFSTHNCFINIIESAVNFINATLTFINNCMSFDNIEILGF